MSSPSAAGASGSDTEQGAPAPPSSPPSHEGLSERSLAKVFLSPALAVMALLGLFPIFYAVYESLFAYSFLQRQEFIGLANYGNVLSGGRFWLAVAVTLLFTLASVALEFLIGLGFALIMNAAFRGRNLVRATILLPWVIPTVIAGQVWLNMFRTRPGYVNEWLSTLPFVEMGSYDWLGGGGSMFWAVVAADVWKTAPFVALLLLAGLQTIPGDVYEAARVDGATAWQRFKSITLPLLKPAIVVALLFRSVDALRIFDLADVMTGARLETLSVLTQRFIIRAPDTGIANTLSTLTFVIIMGIGLIFISRMGRDLVGERT